jgi:hypothetical protein
MIKKEMVIIKDDESKIKFLPYFINKLFIKNYYNQGGVYIKKIFNEEKPVFCSDLILWLEKLKIETYSQKKADELSWKYFNEKYPQYKGFVQLF